MAHSRSSREYPNGRSSRTYPNGRSSREYTSDKTPRTVPPHSSVDRRERRRESLPQYNHNGHEVTKGIHPEGESGRRGFNPLKFLVICGRSSSTMSLLVNLLWPIVPVAIALVCLLCMVIRTTSVLTCPVALRTPRMAPRNLHYQLHRHDTRSQHARFRRAGALAQDAPEGVGCCP